MPYIQDQTSTVSKNIPEIKTNPKLIESVIRALPLLTGYLIFLGISSSIAYFYIFRINILWYISLSEAVLLFLEDVILHGVWIFIAFGFFYRALKSSFIWILKITNGKLTLALFFLLIPLAVPIFDIGNMYYNTAGHIPKDKSLHLVLLFFVVTAVLILLLIGAINSKSILKVDKTTMILCLSFFLFWIYIVSISIHKAVNYKYQPTNNNTVFTLKDTSSPLCTNDTLIFVGKVEKYYFLYDRNEQAAKIIPADEVKNVKWTKEKNSNKN
jgi:hypothetical protein